MVRGEGVKKLFQNGFLYVVAWSVLDLNVDFAYVFAYHTEPYENETAHNPD